MTNLLKGTVFYKMSGSGNDFLMLDGRYTAPGAWSPDRIIGVCDRRHGVGADGLVILTPEGARRVRMDFWNCDGSRADMCGNAALCSTRLAAFLEMAPAEGMQLVTRAGTFPTRCRPAGDEAELNLPDFALPAAPAGIMLRNGERSGLLATVGVPHLVLEVEDLEREDLMTRGRTLRSDPGLGPAGANVNFVAGSPVGSGTQWALRTYERGVEGETLACGTGAVAAAVLLAHAGRGGLPMDLLTRGGRILHIAATLSEAKTTDVWLAGEGRLVFTGVL
jgi:diaminopimelate epimerase